MTFCVLSTVTQMKEINLHAFWQYVCFIAFLLLFCRAILTLMVYVSSTIFILGRLLHAILNNQDRYCNLTRSYVILHPNEAALPGEVV